MTLESVRRYNPERVDTSGGDAVVVGASMAGLLAARVLADSFEHVTLIEKDSLPDEPVARDGVPQGNHVHVMQEAGRRTLEDLFPGFSEELTRVGALMIDLNRDFYVFFEEDFGAHGSSHIPMYCASRPLFEQITRRRVRELKKVTVRENCQFINYLTCTGTSTVEGVTIRDEDEEKELSADLVVDATGRTSRTPTWLEDHGYVAPTTDEVRVDLAYSSAMVERPQDSRRTVLVMPNSPRKIGGGLFPVESGRWLMTLAGFHGDHPSTDPGDFEDFAARLPIPDFQRVIDEHGLVSEDIRHYPFPTVLRRRYEDLERFPDGLLLIGDAIASFNPIYGQGMSVAALEALQLHHTLRSGSNDDLALEFFERAEPVVDDAWTLSVGSDFQFSQTTGPKPPGTDLINAYIGRLLRKSRKNGNLAEAFQRVVIMERRPTSLFQPRIMWKVLRPRR